MRDRLRGADRAGRGAFTLIELAIVTVVVAVLVTLILPAVTRPGRMRARGIPCMNNLKLIGLGFRLFANDNEDKLPWGVSTNQGGSREFLETPFSAFRHFQVISNELSTPWRLLCFRDRQRNGATNWSSFQGNKALSYFVGLDASGSNRSSILSGDRFLGSTHPPTNGLLTLDVLSLLWWTNGAHGGGGNLVKSDLSVEHVESRGLLQALRNSGLATNRLALPLIGP